MKKNKLLISLAVIVIVVLGAAAVYFLKYNKGSISQEQAKQKAQKFVSENLVQPDTKVAVKGVSVENKLYKIDLDVAGQQITAYMTKDGKNFFPQALNMEEVEKEVKNQKAAADQAQVEIPKTDKPKVELFVMSYCPYGTQIEKGILPVLEALDGKIDFQLKFVDYAMHEKKEIDENLKQYCIQKNEPEKLQPYLECFLKDSNKSDQCSVEAGVSQTSLDNCIDDSDKQFKITENYGNKEAWKGQFPPFDVDKADNEKYGVQGSPTLIVNGVEAQTKRDPAGILETICKGFSEKPEQCSTQLSSETPSAGFGEGTEASSTNAGCGN